MFRKVGAVVTSAEGHILSTGYNGPVKGLKNCIDTGICIRALKMGEHKSGEGLQYCVASHAEMNAISFAARNGISLKDGIMYCTTQPCSECMKLIIQAGIKEIYYIDPYSDEMNEYFLNNISEISAFQITNENL